MAGPDPTKPPRGIGSRLMWPAAFVGMALVAALAVSNYATERERVARRVRLQLIWPDYLAIPEKDRQLLDALAVHCHLASEPLALDDSVNCLRRASTDTTFAAPPGVNAATELARILNKRASSAPALPAQALLV